MPDRRAAVAGAVEAGRALAADGGDTAVLTGDELAGAVTVPGAAAGVAFARAVVLADGRPGGTVGAIPGALPRATSAWTVAIASSRLARDGGGSTSFFIRKKKAARCGAA